MYEDERERIYFPAGEDKGYLLDTGNLDARTEGMSYGMMTAVQLDRKELFDRLWRFAKAYMWHASGVYAGYFAWSVQPSGARNAQGPAPDGEEYFAMALLFASHRWGDGAPPLDYGAQARDILRHCLHQHELVAGGEPMWEPENALIKFIPESPYTDPSYHLPHFYELFGEWADEKDRPFWKKAAQASRAYLARACHPVTGLSPEQAKYNGAPEHAHQHGDFYSDAYRVAMNLGLDAAWFGRTAEGKQAVDRLQRFLLAHDAGCVYAVDGTALPQRVLHPVGLLATTAAGSLATDDTPEARQWIDRLRQTPPRTGDRRYYDNCLYLFSLLMLAGRYRIY